MLDDVVSCLIWAKGTNKFVVCMADNKPLLPYKFIPVKIPTTEISAYSAAHETLQKLGLAGGSVATKIICVWKHIFPDGAGHRKFALSHTFVLTVFNETKRPLNVCDNLQYEWTSQEILQARAVDHHELTQVLTYFTSTESAQCRNALARDDLDEVQVRVVVTGPHSYEPVEYDASENQCFKPLFPSEATALSNNAQNQSQWATLQRIIRETTVTKIHEHALYVRFLMASWPSFTLNLSKFKVLFDWNKIVPLEHSQDELGEHIKRLFSAISFVGHPGNYPDVGKPSAKLFKKFVTFSDLLLAFSVCQSSSLGSMAGERRALATYAYYADETSGNLQYDGLLRLFRHFELKKHNSTTRVEMNARKLAKRLKPTVALDKWFIEPAMFLDARRNASNELPTYRLLIGDTIANILQTEWLQFRVSPIVFYTHLPENEYLEEVQEQFNSTLCVHDQLIKAIAILSSIANERLSVSHNLHWLQPRQPASESNLNSNHELHVDERIRELLPLGRQPQLAFPSLSNFPPNLVGRMQHIAEWLSTLMREWTVRLAQLRPLMRPQEELDEEVSIYVSPIPEGTPIREVPMSSNSSNVAITRQPPNFLPITGPPASDLSSASSSNFSNLPFTAVTQVEGMLNFNPSGKSNVSNASGAIASMPSLVTGGMSTQSSKKDHVQPELTVHCDTSSYIPNEKNTAESVSLAAALSANPPSSNSYHSFEEPRRKYQFPSNLVHVVAADSSNFSWLSPVGPVESANESNLVDVVSVFFCCRSGNSTSFALCRYPRGWYMPYCLLHEHQRNGELTKYEAVMYTAERLVQELLAPGLGQLPLPRLHGVMHCWRRLMLPTAPSVNNQNPILRSLSHYCVLVTCGYEFPFNTAPMHQTSSTRLKWSHAEEVDYFFQTRQLLGDELKQLLAEWDDLRFSSFQRTLNNSDLPFSGFSFASPFVYHENQLESPDLCFLYDRVVSEMKVTRENEAALYLKFTMATWPSLSMNQITFQHFVQIEELCPIQLGNMEQSDEMRYSRLYECLCLNRPQYLHYPLLLLGFSVLQPLNQPISPGVGLSVAKSAGERRARFMFYFYDRNHDGYIDFEEFKELLADAAEETDGLLPDYAALANDIDALARTVLKRIFSTESERQGTQFNPTVQKMDVEKFLRSRRFYLKTYRIRIRQSLATIVRDVQDTFVNDLQLPPRFAVAAGGMELHPLERLAKVFDLLHDLYSTAIDIRNFVISQNISRSSTMQHGVTNLNIAYSNALIQYTLSALRAINVELDFIPPEIDDDGTQFSNIAANLRFAIDYFD